MKGVQRYYINLDWEKMIEIHPDASINCMKYKWNLFRSDWAQGWDSDCFGHCSNYDNCTNAFKDESLSLENHMKILIMPIEGRPYVDEWEVYEIKEMSNLDLIRLRKEYI